MLKVILYILMTWWQLGKNKTSTCTFPIRPNSYSHLSHVISGVCVCVCWGVRIIEVCGRLRNLEMNLMVKLCIDVESKTIESGE